MLAALTTRLYSYWGGGGGKNKYKQISISFAQNKIYLSRKSCAFTNASLRRIQMKEGNSGAQREKQFSSIFIADIRNQNIVIVEQSQTISQTSRNL
jgi:hypothetical protein